MRRVAFMAAAALAASAGTARGALVPAQIQFQAFAPTRTDVLPGDAVRWTNTSQRAHTVTADDGSFASGRLVGGDAYARSFAAIGAYPYHCTLHVGMTGEIDVRGVILDPVAPAPVPTGHRVELTGRTADPGSPVRIERDTGSGFHAVTSTTPAPNGRWSAEVPADATADYRALSGGRASETRRLLVRERHITLAATRRGVHVTVTPSDPHARVMLEVLLRERFGWWPTAWTRLDYLSRADFRVSRRPARVRVSIVDRDDWTPLVTSAVLRLPRRHAAPLPRPGTPR
ncbi:MAG: cupredoxin domain-containing protein [Solirubrobacteraceae bacterium]